MLLTEVVDGKIQGQVGQGSVKSNIVEVIPFYSTEG